MNQDNYSMLQAIDAPIQKEEELKYLEQISKFLQQLSDLLIEGTGYRNKRFLEENTHIEAQFK